MDSRSFNGYGIGIENQSAANVNTHLHYSTIERKIESPATTMNHPQRIPLSGLSDNNTPKSILLSGVQRVLVKPKSAEKLQKQVIHTKGNFMKPTEASKHAPNHIKSFQNNETVVTPNSANKNNTNSINSKHTQSFHTQSSAAKVIQLNSNKDLVSHLELVNNNDVAVLHHSNYGTPNRPSMNNRSNRPTSTPPSSKRRNSVLNNTKTDSASKANHTPIRSLCDEPPESSSSHLLYSPLSNKVQDNKVSAINITRSVSAPKPRPSMLCFPFMQTNSTVLEKSTHIHDGTKIAPPSPSTYNHVQQYVESNSTNKASTSVPVQQPSVSTVPHKTKVKVQKGSCIPAPTADILSANKAAKLAALSNHTNSIPSHVTGISSPPLAARYAQATHASLAAAANVKNNENISVHVKPHVTSHKKPPRPTSKIPVPIVGNSFKNAETNVENIQPSVIKQVVTKRIPRITQKKSEPPLVKDLKQVVIQAPEVTQSESMHLDNSGLNDNSILNLLNLSNYLPRTNELQPKIPIKEIRTSYSFGSEISGVYFDSSRAEEQTFSLVESIEFSNSQILDDANTSTQACIVNHTTTNKTDVIDDANEEKQCIFLEENLANLSIVEGPTTFSPCNISLLSNFSQATFGTEYYECPGNSFIPINLLESVPFKEEKLDMNRQNISQVTMATVNVQLDKTLPTTYKPKIKSAPKLIEALPNKELFSMENKLSIETVNIPVVRSDSASSQLSEVSYIFPITRQNSTKSCWTEEYSAFFPPDEMEGNEDGATVIALRDLSKEAIFVSSPLPEQYHHSHSSVRPNVFCSSIAIDEAACSILNKAMIMSSTANSVSDSTVQFSNLNINNSMNTLADEEANNISTRHSVDFSLASCSTLNKAMILSYDQDDLSTFINKIESTTGCSTDEINPLLLLVTKLSNESALVIEQPVVRNVRLSPPSPPWMLQSIDSLPPPPPPPLPIEELDLPCNTLNDSISILEFIPTPNDLVRQFSIPIENFEDLENYDEVVSDYETIEVECDITGELENDDDCEDNPEYAEVDKENIDPQPFLSTGAVTSQKRTTPGSSPLQSITSAININESQETISMIEEEDSKINDIDIADTSVIDKVHKYLLDESHKKFNTAIQSVSITNQNELTPQLVTFSSFENDTFNSVSTTLFNKSNNKMMLIQQQSPSRRKDGMDDTHSVVSLNDSQQQASFTSSMEELQSHNPKSKSEFWVQNNYSNSYSIAANKYENITSCYYDTSKSQISPKHHQDSLSEANSNTKSYFVREDCFDEQLQQQQLCPDPLASQLLNMVDGTNINTTVISSRYYNNSSNSNQNEIVISHIHSSMQHMFLPVNEEEI